MNSIMCIYIFKFFNYYIHLLYSFNIYTKKNKITLINLFFFFSIIKYIFFIKSKMTTKINQKFFVKIIIMCN